MTAAERQRRRRKRLKQEARAAKRATVVNSADIRSSPMPHLVRTTHTRPAKGPAGPPPEPKSVTRPALSPEDELAGEVWDALQAEGVSLDVFVKALLRASRAR